MQSQGITCTCAHCGALFSVKPSRAARGNVRYCGMSCLHAARPHPRRPLAERFWVKVEKTDGCWLWRGSRNKRGYGSIGAGGKYAPVRRAHIVSWEMAYGPVPEGMCVCHTCDALYPAGDITYRACVRPDHLYLGSHQENMDDMKAKGRDNRSGRPPQKAIRSLSQ